MGQCFAQDWIRLKETITGSSGAKDQRVQRLRGGEERLLEVKEKYGYNRTRARRLEGGEGLRDSQGLDHTVMMAVEGSLG